MPRIIAKNTLAAILLLIVFSDPSPAQFTRFGGGLSFSTGIENDNHKTGNPGITARGVFELEERFWLVPQLSFYMPGKRQHIAFGTGRTLFGSADADITFTLATEHTILFYALAGPNLSFLSTSFDSGDSASKIMPAFNIGTGIEMLVEKDLNAFAQIKGVIGSYSQYLVISIGVHYYFEGRRYKTW